MSNKNKLVTVIILFILSSIVALHADDNNWKYYKNINTNEDSSNYYSFYLDAEVYKEAQTNIFDLRIMDASNDIVPYYIINRYHKERTDSTHYETKLISAKKLILGKDKKPSLVVDFQVFPPQKKYTVQKCNLEISGTNYSHQIEVYGRTGTTDWTRIKTDTVYSLQNYTHDTIHFDTIQNYNFYRFVLPSYNGTLNIEKCLLSFDEQYFLAIPFLRNKEVTFTKKDATTITEILINNINKLSLTSLILSADGNFRRTYTITDPISERIISRGVIYNFEHNDNIIHNMKITLPLYTRNKSLLLQIHNEDNSPINITSISGQYLIDLVVFEKSNNPPYRLLYGSTTNMKKPSYDIEFFKGHIKQNSEISSSLGVANIIKMKEIKDQKNSPLTKYLFHFIIIFVSIFLVVFIVLKIKKVQ